MGEIEKLLSDASNHAGVIHAALISPSWIQGNPSKLDNSAEKSWSVLENIVKVISKDAAKLALSFRSNPADINAVKPILETLKQACVTLADNSEHVRGFGGIEFQKYIQNNVSKIFTALEALLDGLSELHSKKKVIDEKLSLCGEFFQACDRTTSGHRTSELVVADTVSKESTVLNDCVSEFQETIDESLAKESSEDVDDDWGTPSWTESEATSMKNVLGLLKVALKLSGKALQLLISPEPIESQNFSEIWRQHDNIARNMKEVSKQADNMAAGAYGLDMDEVHASALLLNNAITAVLDSCDTLLKETKCSESASWIGFLRQASKHNIDQIPHQ
eukprot:m.81961 g.81961  ORF g.81961 m.81961 type:complete len:334 (-) comp12843_c0_seq2:58-1059(-)